MPWPEPPIWYTRSMTDSIRRAERLRDCPGFVRFWTAATVSGFGTYVTALAIQVLVVVTLHQGAAGVGLVSAARWLPYLLLGLVIGVLVDRSRRRPLLVITDLVRAGLLVAVPLLAVSGHLTIVVLMAFMMIFGLASLINDAASQSILPRLVPSSMLTPANARLDQSDAVAQTSGPVIAGGLVSLLTAPWAVLADAASYLISGLLLLRIPVVEPPSRRGTLRGVRSEAAEGLRWVYRHRALGPYAIGTHAWFLCFSVVNVIVPPFALRTLGLSALGLGIALAAGGVGGLTGALAATRVGDRFGAGLVVIASHAGTALAVAAFAVSSGHWVGWIVFGVGQLVLGMSMGVANSNEMGYKQSITPDHLLGRSNATMRSINRAMIVLGAPLGGLLADAIGFRVVLWFTAAGFLMVAAALSATPYRSARVDEVRSLTA
jgi:MFS family permease